MRKKILCGIIAATLPIIAVFANNRNSSEINPDWMNHENWSGATVPTSGPVYFMEPAAGTSTILDRSGKTDALDFFEIKIHSSEVTLKNAKFSISGNKGKWPYLVLGANSGGKADNRTTPVLNIVDSDLTAGILIAADNSFVNSTINLRGKSNMTLTENNQYLAGKDNVNVRINIDTDSSFTASRGFFTTVGDNSTNRHVEINILGKFTAHDLVTDKVVKENSAVTFNVYGNGGISVTGAHFLRDYAKVNLIMHGLDAARISKSATPMYEAKVLRIENLKDDSKIFHVDLKNFSVKGGKFTVGEECAVALISASNMRLSLVNVINENSMGAAWKLAGKTASDSLEMKNGTVYLNVKYVGGESKNTAPAVNIFESTFPKYVFPKVKKVIGYADNNLPAWTLGGFVRPAGVNPIIKPNKDSVFYCPMRKAEVRWEESDTFNPAATIKDGKIYVLYRAEDNSATGIGSRTSRVGMAESTDGINMKTHPAPVLYPMEDDHKEFDWTGGMEDPRVAVTEDSTYVIMYTAWNKENRRARLSVATSKDLKKWTKHGPVFQKAYDGKYKDTYCKAGAIVTAPSKSDPSKYVITKINGKYLMYWGEHRIFAATSDDLINWTPLEDKNNRLAELIAPRKNFFDSVLTEAGPPAIVTKDGILLLYNGKNADPNKGGDPRFPKGAYCAGQVLFDINDPYKVLERLDVPFFRPTESFERSGQYGDGTVFIEGLVFYKGKWFLYYGCADSMTGVAVFDPSKKQLGDSIPLMD